MSEQTIKVDAKRLLARQEKMEVAAIAAYLDAAYGYELTSLFVVT